MGVDRCSPGAGIGNSLEKQMGSGGGKAPEVQARGGVIDSGTGGEMTKGEEIPPGEQESKKNCLIYYKTGRLSPTLRYGDQFDRLEECCPTFKQAFWNTGNKKEGKWGESNLFESKSGGLNFVHRGADLKLDLCGKPIHFCPWCGSRLEVRRSKNVQLRERMKEVPDGFEEVAGC